jgi:sodium/bile acid cotransporter 7
LLVLPFAWLPMERGVLIGLVLVALMPTTLSSGVVMTGAAGGNLAHALQITILANALAVFSIPVVLGIFLGGMGLTTTVAIDRAGLMLKLAGFVLLPLTLGVLTNWWSRGFPLQYRKQLQVLSQFLIFGIVWMGVSQSRQVIAGSGLLLLKVIFLAAVFHGLLLAAAWTGVRLTGMGPGKRESVIFMGVQKTLPLSILLQVSLFPQYGAALVVCVVHHMVHLMIDGYIVGILRARQPAERP